MIYWNKGKYASTLDILIFIQSRNQSIGNLDKIICKT